MSYPNPSSERADERPLSILVMGGGEEGRRTVPLRAGLSIGRDPRNSIVIDHPDVRPVHATMWPSEIGLQLECAAGATVWLADGAELSRLSFVEGTRCGIGDTVLMCIRSEEDADNSHCPRCGCDLATLPQSRRFCPRCGIGLASANFIADVLQQHPLRVLPLEQGDGLVHSHMIAGYATAMNRLGNRYERGQGVARNEDEAVRCYGKAAVLGNEDARTRLEQWDVPQKPE